VWVIITDSRSMALFVCAAAGLLDRRVGMLILDCSYRLIVLRRKRRSLKADFSSLDSQWLDVRIVVLAFGRKPQAVTLHNIH
jgi:hypothetical protein